MKNIIAMAVVTIASASAFAGMSVTIRGDYVNTPEFESRDVNTGTKAMGSSIFRGTVAKIDFDGKVGEATVTGRLDAGLLGTYDSGDKLVEFLAINKEFGNGMTVHAGKLESMNGGFEHAADVVGDVYLATLANGGFGGLVSGAAGATPAGEQLTWLTGSFKGTNGNDMTPAGNSRGVGMTYKMGDNKFDVRVTNASNHGSAGAQRRNNIGVYYSGSFMDKMIMPIFGYMSGSRDTATAGFEDTYMNLGAKMKFGMTGVTVEYLANTDKASATGGKTDGVTSTYALVDYTMDTYKPFLKYEMSEFKNQDSSSDAASFKRTAFNLGVEITPKAGDNFRYHVAYASTSDKYGTAGTKETVAWTQLVAGLKYSADILK